MKRWDNGSMLTLSTTDRSAIVRVCERHGVARLSIFGSALTDDFDPEHSDIDLLVEYRPNAERTFQALFALRGDLEQILGHPVDLIDTRNIRNPYFAVSALKTARELYAA